MRAVSAEATTCQINRLCDYCHQLKNFILHFKGKTNQTKPLKSFSIFEESYQYFVIQNHLSCPVMGPIVL